MFNRVLIRQEDLCDMIHIFISIVGYQERAELSVIAPVGSTRNQILDHVDEPVLRKLRASCRRSFRTHKYCIICSFILKGVPEQKDKSSRFNITEVKVTHTLGAFAFEAATILILLGSWAAAHYTYQLRGTGLLDFPIIEMVCFSVLAVVALIIPYCPRWMNRSEGFVNNLQVLENIKLYRILAIGMSIAVLLTVYLPFKGTYSILDTISRHFWVIILFAEIYMRDKIRNGLRETDTDQKTELS